MLITILLSSGRVVQNFDTSASVCHDSSKRHDTSVTQLRRQIVILNTVPGRIFSGASRMTVVSDDSRFN